jgi:hypothetical protein
MNRFAFALAVLFVAAGTASASIAPQPIRMLENVHAPPEAVAASSGGPAVVLVGDLKSRITLLIPGAGCGSPRDPEPLTITSAPRNAEAEPEYWLDGSRLLYISTGAVAGVCLLAAAALWAARRMKH